MKKFDVYDHDNYIGSIEAEDRKTAKHEFFEEHKDIDADRKKQKRSKCSYGVRESSGK